jgi:hypothetical protein
MNFLINPKEFLIQNVFLSDIKENTIMNGNFIKLIYSTKFLTLNCIFLEFPIQKYEKKSYNGKTYIFFNNKEYNNVIDLFQKIESSLLDLFIQMNRKSTKKKVVYTIHNQLKNGMIKYYQYSELMNESILFMKISGIWETATEIGLTYKLINC